MLHRTAPDKAAAILLGIAVKPVVRVVLEEQIDVFRCVIVQAILQRDIVEEGIVAVGRNGTGRYLAANRQAQAVVQESLGKLEGVVGARLTGGIGRIVHTEREVERAQCITRNAVDL